MRAPRSPKSTARLTCPKARCAPRTRTAILCSSDKQRDGQGPFMNDDQVLYVLPIFIPLFFVAMWLGVTTLIAFMSGWFTLMQQFPDRDEKPLAQLNWQSGFMGKIPVNYRNVLKIGVCPSGLRVGVLRI